MRIILFDGMCSLCSGTVRSIIKRDKKALFRFAAIQSGAGHDLLRQFHIADEKNTLYYIDNSVCFSKSTAVLHILRDLGGIWKCFYPLIYTPACIRDALYLFISRNRYRFFKKKSHCDMPAQEIRNRFL